MNPPNPSLPVSFISVHKKCLHHLINSSQSCTAFFTSKHSQQAAPKNSLIATMHCLITTKYSLITTKYSLITIKYSLIATKHSPPTAPKYAKSQPHPSNTSSSPAWSSANRPRRCTKSHQSATETADSSDHSLTSRPNSRSRPVFELEVVVIPKQRVHGNIHPSPRVDTKPTSANKRIVVGRIEEKSSLGSSLHRSPRILIARIV
jgi:hypothetical protein